MALVDIKLKDIKEVKISVKQQKGKSQSTVGYIIIPSEFIKEKGFNDREKIVIGFISREGEDLEEKFSFNKRQQF